MVIPGYFVSFEGNSLHPKRPKLISPEAKLISPRAKLISPRTKLIFQDEKVHFFASFA